MRKKISGYNIISVAVVILALGISLLTISLVKDFRFGPFQVIGSVSLGFGLSGLYLGAQWERSSTINVVVGSLAGLFSAACVMLAVYYVS